MTSRITTLDGPLRRRLPRIYDVQASLSLAEPPDWTLAAVCASVDPEIFFPEKGGSTREAKRVCTGCPVRDECLQYALEMGERFGIFGGKSERERRGMKAERGEHACRVCQQRFVSLHGLNCHLTTHGDEKLWCTLGCARSFPTARGRAMHERRIHGGFDPAGSVERAAS